VPGSRLGRVGRRVALLVAEVVVRYASTELRMVEGFLEELGELRKRVSGILRVVASRCRRGSG